MALRFFHRLESLDLNTGSGDYSIGDTTYTSATNTGIISAAAARVGTYGMRCVAGATYGISFTAGDILDAVADGSTAEANIDIAIAWSVRVVDASALTTGNNCGVRLAYDGENHVEVETMGTEVWRLSVRKTGQPDKTVVMTTPIPSNEWMGMVLRIDAANDLMRLEMYDENDDFVEGVDLGATLGSTMPPIMPGSAGFQIVSGVNNSDVHFDNIIVADGYDAPVENNFTITHYNQYDEGGLLYVKLLTDSSAASAASVQGVVLNAARDTVIGEFSGQTFEASLEGGEAVLLIALTDITPDGTTLTTSDTPLVSAYNATDGTVGLGSATVVEI